MSVIEDSPTEHMNVLSHEMRPSSHRRPSELAVSHRLENSWFLAIIVTVSSLVGTLVSLAYLCTWVAITNGQGGVAPGFYSLFGVFAAVGTLSMAVLAVMYLVERITSARSR